MCGNESTNWNPAIFSHLLFCKLVMVTHYTSNIIYTGSKLWQHVSVYMFPPRSVWWVWHRGGRAPLVPTQRLSALWHGHLHGTAGAAQHGDRVSKRRGARAVWVMKISFFQIQPKRHLLQKWPFVQATMQLSLWVCVWGVYKLAAALYLQWRVIKGIREELRAVNHCRELQNTSYRFKTCFLLEPGPAAIQEIEGGGCVYQIKLIFILEIWRHEGVKKWMLLSCLWDQSTSTCSLPKTPISARKWRNARCTQSVMLAINSPKRTSSCCCSLALLSCYISCSEASWHSVAYRQCEQWKST